MKPNQEAAINRKFSDVAKICKESVALSKFDANSQMARPLRKGVAQANAEVRDRKERTFGTFYLSEASKNSPPEFFREKFASFVFNP